MILPPENQASLTANSEELGGTFGKMGLSDSEAKLAGIFLAENGITIDDLKNWWGGHLLFNSDTGITTRDLGTECFNLVLISGR